MVNMSQKGGRFIMLKILILSILLAFFSCLISLFCSKKISDFSHNLFIKRFSKQTTELLVKSVHILIFCFFLVVFSILIGKNYNYFFDESLRHLFVRSFFITYFIVFFMLAFRKET